MQIHRWGRDSEGRYFDYYINIRLPSREEIRKSNEYLKKSIKYIVAFFVAVIGGVIGCLLTDSIGGFAVGAVVITIAKIIIGKIINKFAKTHPKLFKLARTVLIIGICILPILAILSQS